jgi:hypothetical protein
MISSLLKKVFGSRNDRKKILKILAQPGEPGWRE